MDWLITPFEVSFVQRALWGGLLVSCVCALAGTWIVVRGMAFLGDAMAHGMLPGVAVASLLGGNLLLGAAVSAAAMAAGVSVLGRNPRFTPDIAIGLLFAGMLSAGVIIVSRSQSFAVEVTSFLFGDVLAIRDPDIAYLVAALGIAATITILGHRAFVALTFDPRKAATLGLRPRVAHAALLTLVTLAIVSSFHVVGTLLVFGLLIAPPAAATYWSNRIPVIMLLAALSGGLATVAGLTISWHAGTAAGATIAGVAVASFFVSAVAAQVRDRLRARRTGGGGGTPPGPVVHALPLGSARVPRGGQRGRTFVLTAIATMALPVAGCGADRGAESADERPHGYIAGAEETAEEQPRLVVADRESGAIRIVDLTNGQVAEAGSADARQNDARRVERLLGDGRFAYSVSGGTVRVIDGGSWIVDHGDHVHYYRAGAREVGRIEPARIAAVPGGSAPSPDRSARSPGGSGAPPDSSPPSHRESVPALGGSESGGNSESGRSPSATGESGSARALVTMVHSDAAVAAVGSVAKTVLLDRTALGAGEIVALGTVEGMAVPYGERLVVTLPGSGRMEIRARDGSLISELSESCPAPSGQAVTRRGAVFGCADGAVVVKQADGAFTASKIAYPQPVSESDRATEFTHRPGSSTLVAKSGERGVWVLDVARKAWTFVAAGPVVAANSAGDTAPLLTLTADGTLRAFDIASGSEIARARPITALPAAGVAPVITVDSNRAYITDEAGRAIYEIDYRDDLRLARTFPLDITPSYLVETGL
ncbi:zinc ABC transporter permease AztB [Nocardia jejuensis]|uniref:zinc ABC transporter permease AztB n=1 Tax=Nocardia jejuensis TaxID=328049 RepID=UPI000834A13A|nr:zinc ABC transporter permease AztB [Nocardia jejuensis]